MKTLKIAIIVILIAAGAANAQFTKAELQVSGLTCSMCSKATEKSLSTLSFISSIKADLNRNVFVITFKKDAPVDLDLISKKVQSAGFSVNNLKAIFNFDNVKISDNHFNYSGDTYHLVNAAGKLLSGAVAVTIVDKGFEPSSVYKKYSPLFTGSTTSATGHLYHLAI